MYKVNANLAGLLEVVGERLGSMGFVSMLDVETLSKINPLQLSVNSDGGVELNEKYNKEFIDSIPPQLSKVALQVFRGSCSVTEYDLGTTEELWTDLIWLATEPYFDWSASPTTKVHTTVKNQVSFVSLVKGVVSRMDLQAAIITYSVLMLVG